MSDATADRTPRRTIRTRWIVAGAIALVVIAVAVTAVLLQPKAPQVIERTFTAPITKTNETTTVTLTGTLAPQNVSNLSFTSAGKVTAVSATVGATVKAGDVLATIDATQLQNAVDLANANLAAANSSASSASGGTSAQRASATAQVNSAKAKLASAQTALANAKLTSPIDGLVATVNIKIGDQVGTSGGASTIASTGMSAGAGSAGAGSSAATSTAHIVVISPASWQVNATVSPADIGKMKVGQAVTATVANASTSISGKVSSVGIVATTSGTTTSFPVIVTLDGTKEGLYDGVSMNLAVTTDTLPDVVTVPTAATSSKNGETTVQKMVDGSPVTTKVTTGKVFGDRTQITSGLTEGDQVQITTRIVPGAQRSAGINMPGMGGQQGQRGTRPNAQGAQPADAPAGAHPTGIGR